LRRDKEKVDTELVETKKKSSEEIKVIRENQMSGASDKYNQLLNENVELRRKIDGLESEYDKLKRGALENNSANDREIARLRTENEKYLAERKEAEKHKKIGFMDVTQEAQLVNRNIELEKKIKQLESDLEKYKTKDEVSIAEIKILNERIKKLQIELEIARKEVEAAQASKSRLQSTVYQSGFKQSGIVSEHIESSVARSPRSPTYKSSVIYEKGLSSPQESSMSR
jgi:chromosome segregation ATPase